MFWRFGFNKISKIEEILARPEYTLEEILNEEDVLQECKTDRGPLLDFLSRDDTMGKLLDYVTVEPPKQMDEKQRFKYPNIASEVLSCDSFTIIDALCRPAHLERVWGILNSEAPLHPLVGSFFLKMVTALSAKKQLETLEYLRARPFIVERMLFHLDTPALADALMRVCSMGNEADGVSFQTWIVETCHLVDALVQSFAPESHTSLAKLCNTEQLIQDMVFTYRKETLDPQAVCLLKPIYCQLISEGTVEQLLQNLLRLEGAAIERGLQVLQDLLSMPPRGEDEPPYSEEEKARHATEIAPVLRGVAKHVPQLHELLLKAPAKSVTTASGAIGVPLGSTRVKTLRLLQCLMATNSEEVFQAFERLGTLGVCLDFFFGFPDNNFAQKHVSEMVTAIVAPANGAHPLYKHLVVDCQLLKRVLVGWSASEEQRTQHKMRLGYMGHLAGIAMMLADLPDGPSNPGTLTPEDYRSEWVQFVAEDLKAYRDILKAEIGGPKPDRPASPATSVEEDSPGGQDLAAASAEYIRFLHQRHYGPSMPDDFNFSEDREPDELTPHFGTTGDFDDPGEFQVEPHDWTSEAVSAKDWQISDGLNGPDDAMGEDEWTERQIEDSAARAGSSSDSDDNSASPTGEDSDSDEEGEASFAAGSATTTLDVPLSPRGAQAVAKMPTEDPFKSPRARKLNLTDEDGGWAHFDEPRAMDVGGASGAEEAPPVPPRLNSEEYSAILDEQLAEPLPPVGPLRIGGADDPDTMAAMYKDKPLPPTPFSLTDEQLLTEEQEEAELHEAQARAAAAAADDGSVESGAAAGVEASSDAAPRELKASAHSGEADSESSEA